MRHGKATVDSVSVQSATHFALSYGEECVKHAIGYLTDHDKDKRAQSGLCKLCHYVHTARIGGCAMTYQPCGICGEDQLYSSTATDKLCLPCAKKHQLCKRCTADVCLRPRRIFKP